MQGRKLGLATAAVAVAITSAVAQGGETDRAVYDFQPAAKRPGKPTALRLNVVFKHPEDPEGKPAALDTAEIGLPRGMRIDDAALPRCEATDDDFRMHGRQACPPETQVGEGAVTVMTGIAPADPRKFDIVAFNAEGEIAEVVFVEGTNVMASIDRVSIEDGKLVPHPPAPPGGPPDGRTAIRELELNLARRIGPEGDAYVTTPPRCRKGWWRSTARFGFNDGSTTEVRSRSRCRRRAR
jgi:hypothetical protein